MDTIWEYHVIKFNAGAVEDLQNTLNDLGTRGWELVSVYPVEESGFTSWVGAALKRRREKEAVRAAKT